MLNLDWKRLPKSIKVKSEQQTIEIARQFSKVLRLGDFVALFGGLGAGKTAFTRGLCDGLGFYGNVCSPTFAIINEYKTKNCLIVHCDMYRIAGEDDLFSVGFFDYLNGRSILVVEWSENILQFLPSDCFRVEIEWLSDEDRLIKIRKGVLSE